MINLLNVLTAVHVLAVVLWVGGGFVLNILVTMAFRSGDPAFQASLLGATEKIGQRVFIPLSLIVLGAGLWLTSKYYEFNEFWINYGFVGIVVTSVVGAGFLGPRSGKIAKLIEAGTPQDQVQATARPLIWIARVDLLVLISVICVMVIKPT